MYMCIYIYIYIYTLYHILDAAEISSNDPSLPRHPQTNTACNVSDLGLRRDDPPQRGPTPRGHVYIYIYIYIYICIMRYKYNLSLSIYIYI